jgi:hypothetical protein
MTDLSCDMLSLYYQRNFIKVCGFFYNFYTVCYAVFKTHLKVSVFFSFMHIICMLYSIY